MFSKEFPQKKRKSILKQDLRLTVRFQAVPARGLGLHQSRQWLPHLVRVAGKYQCPQTRATHQQSTTSLGFDWFLLPLLFLLIFFFLVPLPKEKKIGTMKISQV